MPITSQSLTIDYSRAAARVAPKWLTKAGVIDQAFGPNVMWKQAWKRFNKDNFDGGERVFFSVDLDTGGGEGSYSGYDQLTITPPNTETTGQVITAEYARPVSYSFRDRDLVRGVRAVGENMKLSFDKAMRRLFKDMNDHLQSDDGTGNSNKRLKGMKLWIASDPTASASPAGIPQDLNTNWQNQFSNGAGVAFSLPNLRTLVTASTWGDRGPTFAVCSRAFRNKLEGSMTDTFYHNPVIGDPGEPRTGKSGDPSVGKLYYRGIPIYEDPAYTVIGSGTIECLFIDERSFYFSNANVKASIENIVEFVPLDRQPAQTADVGFVRTHLQAYCVERRVNGIYTNYV